MWAYYAAVFLSAFLLFLIQPMLSKALLPGFGGSYLVWGASMVFYQGMLLVGYLSSHFLQRRLGVVRYARWHWILLFAPFALCPFDFERLGIAESSLPLALGVFALLFAAVSLPFLTLSMTSLILQRWLAVSDRETNPYVLYSVSNLGSLLALVCYPLLIEPFSSLRSQGLAWWWGYGLLVLLHVFCIPRSHQLTSAEVERDPAVSAPASWSDKGRWLLLSLAACAMLLAVTNVMTLDVASIPFLWVLPLVVYLFAFVLTFKRVPWFPVWMQRALYWVVVVGVTMHMLSQLRLAPPVAVSIAVHLLVLFVISVNCCGRLVQTKPDNPCELTTFYVTIAVGGLLGSLVVSWIVPLVSHSLIEYLLALALTCLAVGTVEVRAVWRRLRVTVRGWGGCALEGVLMALAVTLLPCLLGRWLSANLLLLPMALPVALLLRYRAGAPLHTSWLLLVLVASTPWTEQLAVRAKGVTRLRNYYGIYKIYDRDGLRYLQHGSTQHGRQYLEGPQRAVPLAYFHPSAPAGGVLQHTGFDFAQIGMIGLGTGALAAYAGEGQAFTIYELDPDNGRIAEEHFGYLAQARRQGAVVSHIYGDGRVALRARESGSLDLLIIDAFSSGAIPVHLLTTEAFRSYLRVLKSDGIVLLHVSNKMLDLLPVIHSNARAVGAMVCEQTNAGNCHPDAECTDWDALTLN
ncbi:MAG: fused MFS/spermidine synthase, partial [Verrucomicrobia bacterium]|nr:fused MFS/spermidine synthase [Verrucomicrobiota bacterium]